MTDNFDTNRNSIVGRFAPSPTGRMHLGNLFTALLSWLSAKKDGGKWILRIEDLDPQRSKLEFARQIEDDLHWLGLDWDEGGVGDIGPHGPYSQSRRGEIYTEYLDRLKAVGYTYPCCCTRADLKATQAPHQSDGRIIYSGKCRPTSFPNQNPWPDGPHAVRLHVPDSEIRFTDRVFGDTSVNLSSHCGDFVLRRADGAWAYQLAVVIDDALMGVTQVMRGHDLLLSAAQQIYLYNLLGFTAPEFAHVPLVCNATGIRLSKRDASLSAETLRKKFTPQQLLGQLAYIASIIPSPHSISLEELLSIFNLACLPATPELRVDSLDL